MATKKDLSALPESDLISMGTDLGLKFDPALETKASMVDAILTASNPEATEIPASAEEPEPRVRIIVHHQEGLEASKFVKVQINGTMYTLPRETELTVPESVLGVLNDAVQTVTVYENGKAEERNARRFPYTVLGPAK